MEKKTEIFVALQEKWIELNGIKNGDRVRVIKKLEKNEGGCTSGFYDRDYVGNEYTIQDSLKFSMGSGINLKDGPVLPYFCLEKVEDKKFFKRGDKFKSDLSGIKGTYLLSSASRGSSDPYLTLVCIEGVEVGNCLHYAVRVDSVNKVTEEEMIKMCDKKEFYKSLVKV